jgi:methionine sulfoxide reductase heme-binding subunit
MAAARHHYWPRDNALALAVAVAPAIWLAALAWDGDLGVRAVHEAIKISGDWALRLFWLTLLVSPARRILSAPRLIRARRILGLGTFGLTMLHLGLYAFELQFDWGQIGMEIVLRTYLLVGAAATIGLAALAATSTDRAIARLGSRRWNQLHSFVYVIAALSLLHFLLRFRINTSEPMLMIGLFAWLMGYRLMHRWIGTVSTGHLFALAAACAILTAAAETGWHSTMTGVDPWRLLAANLDISDGLRPALWVLIAGSIAAVASFLSSRPSRRGAGRGLRPAPQRPIARISSSNAVSGATQGQSAS